MPFEVEITEIPEFAKEGIRRIASLSDEQAANLLDALKSTRPALAVYWLASEVSTLAGIDEPSVTDMLTALMSLSVMTVDRERPHEIVAGVVRAASDQGIDGLTEGSSEAQKLGERLLGLLDTLPFAAGGKAHRLRLAQPNNYRAARIITDMRPLFSRHGEVKPIAAMVIHSLLVRTFVFSNMSEAPMESQHHMALDLDDLHELKAQIERAIEKEKALRASMADADLPCVRTSANDV